MVTPKVISRQTKDLPSEYKWGFVTDIEVDRAPKGINEDIVRLIAAKKNEPEWMLDWRLEAYRYWAGLEYKEPR
ncbi:MAG: Fe-S cluster assembly protein SufB, partial [Acidimicrobiia bacterium]